MSNPETRIEQCGRTVTEPVVAFDIRFEPPPEDSGRVEWAAVISDGEHEVRLGHERTGGEFSGQYVVDESTGRRQDVPEDADVSDGEVVARFPRDVVGVAADWPTWTVWITVDGEAVAHRVVPTS